jgi:hypothetical protein
MVQVHTLYEGSAWRNKVDGLQQGVAHASRTAALTAGRAIAAELGAEHHLHDVDGTVVERHVYETGAVGWLGAMAYTA